jgi:L-lactate dehydrogenase (cytochrome)
MPPKGWAYYSSAADDEITHRENHLAYHRIWFRPRILRNVTTVDFSTTILGQKTSMPIYITATALGKLGHPDGELNLARAAATKNVIQMVRAFKFIILALSTPLSEMFNDVDSDAGELLI